jgi:cytochrome c2
MQLCCCIPLFYVVEVGCRQVAIAEATASEFGYCVIGMNFETMRQLLTILAVLAGVLLVIVACLWGFVSLQLISEFPSVSAVTGGPETAATPAAVIGVTPASSAQERGQAAFEGYGCVGCHTGEDSPVAPTLVGLYGSEVRLDDGSSVLADNDYLYESIADPGARVVDGYVDIMPRYENFDESMIFDLVAYIRSLGQK